MPRVNIYIRNEDLDRWNAIEDKPEWLHEKLSTVVEKIVSVYTHADEVDEESSPSLETKPQYAVLSNGQKSKKFDLDDIDFDTEGVKCIHGKTLDETCVSCPRIF